MGRTRDYDGAIDQLRKTLGMDQYFTEAHHRYEYGTQHLAIL
jgi:hypothetical protein